MNEIDHRSISERIKKLIVKNGVTDYRVWKSNRIPGASFSNMINNKSPWKLEFLYSIAIYFKVSFDWLIFGEKKYIEAEIVRENIKLKEEILLLKEETQTYRAIEKMVHKKKKKQQNEFTN